MPKTALRRQLLVQRSSMDQASWQTASRAAQLRLAELDLFVQATCIVLYAPIRQEVDTELLFYKACSEGKQVLYPSVCGDELQFREVEELSQCSPGSFGILEPCLTGNEFPLSVADLIVVPGVAFDLQGHRIGFGKGYYDRCLSRLPKHGHLIGLCHDFQVLDHIPAEEHDVRMKFVVTEKRLIAPEGA